MFFSRPAGHRLCDRGEVASPDFTYGDFTHNNAWHDLDLSSIVPKGAVRVILNVSITGTGGNQALYFRKKGRTTSYCTQGIFIGVAAGLDLHNVEVFCDVNRVIQYNGTTSLSVIDVSVVGWFK